MHVNLLPTPFLRRLALRRLAVRWSLVAVFTLLVGGSFVAARHCALREAQHAQSITASESRELHAVKTETERLTAQAKQIESSITALEKAKPEDRTLALVGLAATNAKKLVGKVHLKTLATQMAAVSAPTQASSAPPTPAGQKPASGAAGSQTPNDFVLEGTAEEAAAISTFIELLRESGVFSRVDLTATSEAGGSSDAARQFRIDCKF